MPCEGATGLLNAVVVALLLQVDACDAKPMRHALFAIFHEIVLGLVKVQAFVDGVEILETNPVVVHHRR